MHDPEAFVKAGPRTYAGIAIAELRRAFPDVAKELRRYGLMAFESSLTVEGYQPQAPADWSRFGGVNVDRSVCQRTACESCGHVGLDYRPWMMGRSYRVIARCPACGEWDEW